MSKKYNEEVEYDEDLEYEDFYDEDLDYSEEDADYDNSQNDTGKTNEKLKFFLGIAENNGYKNNMDYVVNGVMNNGIWGVISGALISAAAVVSHVIGVAIRNIVFGEAVHLNFSKAIEEATAKKRLKQEIKDAKDEKKKEKEVKKEEKKEEKKEAHQKSDDEKNSIEDEFNKSTSENIEEYLNEINSVNEKCKNDPELLHNLLVNVISCPNMENFQKEFGVQLFVDKESDRVYILNKNKENDLSNLPYIKKMDLLEGKAQNLGPVFYDKDRNDGKDPDLAAAADALIFSSKIKNEIYAAVFSEMRSDMIPENDDHYMMSYIVSNTPNNNACVLNTMLCQTNESVDIFYKNQLVGTIDLTESYADNADKLYDQIVEIEDTKGKNTYCINDKVSFQKTSPESVIVSVNGMEKEFHLKEQADMKVIADFIAEQAPEKKDIASIDALIIGAKMNPYMDKMLDENGFQLNPFTGNPVDKGDYILTIDENYVPTISEYNIEITSSVGLAGCSVEMVTPITSIYPEGMKENLFEIENILSDHLNEIKERKIPEQLVPISSIVFGEVEKTIDKPIETEKVADARNIYHQLEENALFTGKDLAEYNVIINEEVENEYNEPPIPEDMIREAEKFMRETGEDMEI